MSPPYEAQALVGATAYGQDGKKIGNVSAIYLDNATDEPEWLTVTTGLFGRQETFVPIALAHRRGEGEVELDAGKDMIAGAPKIDPDGQLAQSEEAQLFEYYGIDYGHRRSPTGLPETGQPAQSTDDAMTGSDADDAMTGSDADDAMTRSEERVRVGTRTEQTGRARLRKYVVTEEVQQAVPVSYEQARIEREPITDANREAAMSGPDISEAEHEVTLHAERPVAAKETVPVERVRLTKERVSGEQTVSGQVRKEQIEAEGNGDIDTDADGYGDVG